MFYDSTEGTRRKYSVMFSIHNRELLNEGDCVILLFWTDFYLLQSFTFQGQGRSFLSGEALSLQQGFDQNFDRCGQY